MLINTEKMMIILLNIEISQHSIDHECPYVVSDTDLNLTDPIVFRRSAVRSVGLRGRVSGLCASAQLPAAERRLMVWPPSALGTLERTVACSRKVGQSDLRMVLCVESRDKQGTIIPPAPPILSPTLPQN